MIEALVGNSVAEKVLLYIQNYGEGYTNAIAQTFDVAPSQVFKQLVRMERGGLLVAKQVGRTRTYSLNPRLVYKEELSALLEKVLMRLPDEDQKRYFRNRTRPRRAGKAL